MDAPGVDRCGRRADVRAGVHEGALYGAGNDHVHDSAIEQTAGRVVAAESREGGGGIFRTVRRALTSCGLQPDTTQIIDRDPWRAM
jgi:hypothetical protein